MDHDPELEPETSDKTSIRTKPEQEKHFNFQTESSHIFSAVSTFCEYSLCCRLFTVIYGLAFIFMHT